MQEFWVKGGRGLGAGVGEWCAPFFCDDVAVNDEAFIVLYEPCPDLASAFAVMTALSH
jgi:hypothetical protein